MRSPANIGPVINGIVWPPIPANKNNPLSDLLSYLGNTEHFAPSDLQTHQLSQINELIKYAYQHAPYYKTIYKQSAIDLKKPLSLKNFQTLPIMDRNMTKKAGRDVISVNLPDDHGSTLKGFTTGSTGTPLEYHGTSLTQFFWNALTLREHLWHQRDFSLKLAVIREGLKKSRPKSWGMPVDLLYKTGPAASLDIQTDIHEQIRWLQDEKPDYLLTYPSNIHAIAILCKQKNIKLKTLKQIRTISEVLRADTRELCRDVFNVEIADIYSAREVGYLAFQCPEYGNYHIQSESIFFEILDENNQSCPPGVLGKVVVTPLHNFAMPLIRYELGDYASFGEPCACGRGLPVIQNIAGRKRNLVVLPDGQKYLPNMNHRIWISIPKILQVQMIQKNIGLIEVKIRVSQELTADEKNTVTKKLQKSLGHAFQFTFSYSSSPLHKPGEKFEDFVSEILPA